jgi:hypothetical protein
MRQPPEPEPERERPICTDLGLVKMRLIPEFTEAPPDFEPGDTFKVDIYADINVQLTSYGFHLVYDQALLNLESFAAAPPFRPLPAPEGQVAAITWPNNVVGDDVLLATAVFRAMGPEDVTATISAAYDVTDPTEGFAQRTCGFADLEVTPTDVRVPEPAALMLLGLGFFVARRR